MSLPLARPIVHMLSYSPVTARAAVAMPMKKVPASAELKYVFIFISCQWGICGDLQNTIVRLVGSSVSDPSYVFKTVVRPEGTTRITTFPFHGGGTLAPESSAPSNSMGEASRTLVLMLRCETAIRFRSRNSVQCANRDRRHKRGTMILSRS